MRRFLCKNQLRNFSLFSYQFQFQFSKLVGCDVKWKDKLISNDDMIEIWSEYFQLD